MPKRSKLILGGLLLAVGALTLFVLWHSEPEPIYQGKRLSLWLAQGASGFDSGADDFLRQNSAVVRSYLIASLRKGDNPLWKRYMWLRGHSPAFVSARMPPWMEPRLVRVGATYWLAQQGPRAPAAIPELRQVGFQDQYPDVRSGALWALGRVDSASQETVTLLIAALSKDKDHGVRQIAAGVLEVWAPADAKVIPALVLGLSDSDAVVRQISAAALGKYSVRAKVAVETLKHLAASDVPAADYAARALEQILKGDIPP